MPALTRDGVDLYFEVHGSGPALLLTHGYSATAEMWTGQIESLAADHTLITWDMRGHGRSDSPTAPEAYSAELTVADMAALLDHVEASSAIVGGLSLGGYMSLAFHLAHPERVRAAYQSGFPQQGCTADVIGIGGVCCGEERSRIEDHPSLPNPNSTSFSSTSRATIVFDAKLPTNSKGS